MIFTLSSSIVLLLAAGSAVARSCVKRNSTSPVVAPIPGNKPAQGGKCPAGFLNTVFNTGAPKNAGWPQVTWDSLSSHGVNNFVGYSLVTLSQNPHYNTASGAAPSYAPMDAAQIPICMDPSDIEATKSKATAGGAPAFILVFNEPDLSYGGFTPLTSAKDAAQAIQPLVNIQTSTKWISPAPAFTGSDYLTTFAASCNGCMDKVDTIAAHVYSPDPAGALSQITGLHGRFPDKKIWITELAPASSSDQGCTLDAGGMIKWMQTVVPQIAALGYVDKIFWNCGEFSSLPPANNPNVCNPSLTNADGSPTALLRAFGGLC